MVTTLHDDDRPEPWSRKKKPVAPSTRETRTSAKATAGNEREEDAVASSVPTGGGRGRRKGKTKVVNSGKGLKKTKTMPIAAADVVLGRAEKTVQSVEEQNRKTEEDARACGRVARTISSPALRKTCPTTRTLLAAGDEEIHNSSPPMSSAVPGANSNTAQLERHAKGMTYQH